MFGGKRQSAEKMNQASVMNLTIDFNESVFGATKVCLLFMSVRRVRTYNKVLNLQGQQV